jgi:hypothetical protein
LDLSGSGYGQVVGTCEFGNETSGCIKFVKFRENVRTCKILKKVYAPWN